MRILRLRDIKWFAQNYATGSLQSSPEYRLVASFFRTFSLVSLATFKRCFPLFGSVSSYKGSWQVGELKRCYIICGLTSPVLHWSPGQCSTRRPRISKSAKFLMPPPKFTSFHLSSWGDHFVLQGGSGIRCVLQNKKQIVWIQIQSVTIT